MKRVFWFYGRSGAGKTTLSSKFCTSLRSKGLLAILIDGDELRTGLCNDLSYDDAARCENHRRAAEVASLAASQGFLVVVATMAPQKKQRDIVNRILQDQIYWLYVNASVESCIARDPKGLYLRAKGEGNPLDIHFEEPDSPEIDALVKTENASEKHCVEQILLAVAPQLALA